MSDSLNVLLIEDNPGDARLIREMLCTVPGFRFAMQHVSGLEEGLVRLSKISFDVLILDLLLPESQGIGTFRRVREFAPTVPVVVLTGSDDDVLAAEALQAGAQDYLVKDRVDRNLLARSLRYAVERGRIEEQLRQRAIELTEAGKRKDEFLAILSHELRNPLSPLTMVAELLRNPTLSDEERRWAQGVIERQVRTLTRLIDDLLDISRISRGKIVLRKSPLDVLQVIRRALEVTSPQFKERGHELTLSLPHEPMEVEADAVRLEQVIINLLTNAAKYTPPCGQIWVSAVREDGQAVIRIRDTGIGIPSDMLERIFDMFTQVDPAMDRPSQWGLGIGLALVRELVALHGGVVKASSRGHAQGSEFIVSLPLLLPAVDPAHAPAQGAGGNGIVTDHCRKILVVEDHPESGACLVRVLSAWNHEARLAHNGPAALAMAEEFLPDMVLLDIGLPDMDGYHVAQEFRRRSKFNDTILLALTGYGRQEDQDRALAAGFDFHLVKPVDLDALRKLIATAARRPQQAEA